MITIRERETPYGDDIRSVEGLGARAARRSPSPLTISMLALAGLPGTAGFIGKLYLIEATVDADYTWLGVMIAIGTMISLAYYLRVIAAIWMRPGRRGARRASMPAIAGASQEADAAVTGGRCKVILGLLSSSPRRPSSSASSPRRWSTGRPPPATRSARSSIERGAGRQPTGAFR